jgi:hypothetical protein
VRLVVASADVLVLSSAGLDGFGESLTPFGKVRSSTNPASRLLGNMDSYAGLGNVLARCKEGLRSDAIWGDWLLECVDMDAGVWQDDRLAAVVNGSGDDSVVESPPATTLPYGCSTSRSLRK